MKYETIRLLMVGTALPFLLIVQPYLPAYQGARRDGLRSGRNPERTHEPHEGQRQNHASGEQSEAFYQSFGLPHRFADPAARSMADMPCFVHSVSGRNEQYQRKDDEQQPSACPFPSRHIRSLLSLLDGLSPTLIAKDVHCDGLLSRKHPWAKPVSRFS